MTKERPDYWNVDYWLKAGLRPEDLQDLPDAQKFEQPAFKVRDFLIGERQGKTGREIAIKFQRLDGRTFTVEMPEAIARSLALRLRDREP